MNTKVFMFHLMPWADLRESYEGPAWVRCSNANYDGGRQHSWTRC